MGKLLGKSEFVRPFVLADQGFSAVLGSYSALAVLFGNLFRQYKVLGNLTRHPGNLLGSWPIKLVRQYQLLGNRWTSSAHSSSRSTFLGNICSAKLVRLLLLTRHKRPAHPATPELHSDEHLISSAIPGSRSTLSEQLLGNAQPARASTRQRSCLPEQT